MVNLDHYITNVGGFTTYGQKPALTFSGSRCNLMLTMNSRLSFKDKYKCVFSQVAELTLDCACRDVAAGVSRESSISLAAPIVGDYPGAGFGVARLGVFADKNGKL